MTMSGKEKETKTPARENITLKHTETKRQDVKLSEKEIGMMRNFEKSVNPKGDLTNDEITMINILEKQKLFMERIAIKINQTRQALALTLFKAKDLQAIIDSLTAKGIVTSREAPAGKVFYLTEAGLEFLDLL
jgi:predicted transcriptional regulator